MDIGGVVSSFFNNAGPGGVVVLLVIGVACMIYYSLARWIVAGGKGDKAATHDEHSESMDA
jgi:hypothetical protein